MVRPALSRLAPVKVAVVGDLILDTYTIGKALRISPEAPVPVLSVQREEMRAGGAGNVVLNLLALGASVVPIMRLGNDPGGATLHTLFQHEGIPTEGIFQQAGYITPIKNRIIADSQQIVRVDHEQITPLPELLEQQIIEALPTLLRSAQVIAVSDYGKGFISRTLFAALVDYAAEQAIPIIVDPKDLDFSLYRGAFIIKPNQAELFAAARMGKEGSLDDAAAAVLELSEADVLMVTRSEHGISLFHREGARHDFPVEIQQVRDVTGAGDTVLAMLAAAIANKLSVPEAAVLSNIAAGIAISRFGCARVTLSDVAGRLLQLDMSNKVFDDEHLFALRQVLKDKKVVLLALNGCPGLSTMLFKTICTLAKRGEALILYLCDPAPSHELIDLLAALPSVDVILLHTPAAYQLLLEGVAFAAIYRLEGEELLPLPHIEAVSQEYKL